MARSDEPAIRLCGGFEVTLEGRSLAHALPGRQGRLLLAYLVVHRERAVSRDELADLLWPEQPPASPEDVLGALVSKLRRVLGADRLPGRQELRLELPPGARADVELAVQNVRDAEAALAAGDPAGAIELALRARGMLSGEFLPGYGQTWVHECRRQLADCALDCVEIVARAGLTLGGPALASAERAARELVAAEPLRERGYRLLMEVLAAREDLAGALGVYEQLRVRLREGLGIAPGAATRALHERLLRGADDVTPALNPPPASQPAREERKLVTVLSAQLETAGAQDDPEDLRAAATSLQQAVADELDRLGATLHSAAQGTVIALFGVPHAHEDDAERAVRTGAGWLERGLVARARVAGCELLVTHHEDGSLDVIGAALADATRIARNTPRGALHADTATFEATRHAFAFAPEPFGGSWKLRGPVTVPLEHLRAVPFVGRARELSALQDLLRAVRDEQRPRLVALTGQAGVGKSRLVDELVTQCGETTVYRGRCLAYGEGITFWPLREILWAAAGIVLGDDAPVAAEKLRTCVQSVVGEAQAPRVAAALAVAAGISVPANPIERLAPGSVAEEISLAWPAFLTALAERGPALVIVEDLHWAEEPVLDMLELMVDRARGPLLFVVTARPEFARSRSSWNTLQLALEPLTDAESQDLVAALLPNASEEVRGEVANAAEGNPFFAEELARHVDQPGDSPEVPATVRALIAARVDGLPEAEKQVLQDAAVVGRVFWRATLDAIEPRADVMPVLGALERRGLVAARVGSLLPGEAEFAFRHGLIREVVYRSIPRARRCAAHAAVGGWLERLVGDRRDEFVELLAYHFEAASAPGDAALAWPRSSPEHAELKAKAVAALVDAGGAARRRMTLRQALRYAHRARALAGTAEQRLAAAELEARTHHAAARGEEARVAYGRAMEIASALGETQTLQRLRAHALLLCVRYEGTFSSEIWRPWAVQLVDDGLAADSGAPSFERGTLLLARGWRNRLWLRQADLPAAKQDARAAIAIARRVEAPELLGAAMEVLTWLVFEEGCCEAEAMAQRLVAISADSADRGEAHENLVTAAMSFRWAGRFDRAAEVGAQFAEREAELGSHRALHGAAALTLLLAPTGKIEELGRATERVLELAEDEGEATCKVALVAVAGRALWLFELLETERGLDAVALLRRLRRPRGRPMHDYSISEMLRPFLGVQATFEALQTFAPHGGHAIEAILSLRAKLPVLALRGDLQALEAHVREARDLAVRACAPALGWIADWAAAAAGENPAGVLGAADALERYGERYTAARLLLDAAGLFAAPDRSKLAALAAERFDSMGALASAAAARGVPVGAPVPETAATPATTPEA